MNDKPHDECGIFGIYDVTAVSDIAVGSTYYALYALQHRGQESCGICVANDGIMKLHKGLGLVPEVLTHPVLESLGSGNMAIGHVKYSTNKVPQPDSTQPLLVHHVKGSMAIAYNGSITNSHELREELELSGGIFHSTADIEIIAYMITRARLTEPSIEKAVSAAMCRLKGAYSIVVMSPRKLIAVRDPYGFRPLCIGKLGNSVIFASESCALTTIGAELVRDVSPGEIVVSSPDGMTSLTDHCGGKVRLCSMEYIYFARPDSVMDGENIHNARKHAGALLAKSHPVDADVVIANPDSALDAALGYAEESGIPYGIGIVKNRYIGRTFIKPTQSEREESVYIKLAPLKATVCGKRVIVVDDSIVRGTTTRHIVAQLRLAGAKEIHLRISSPPFKHQCYFGIDIDKREDLIANSVPDESTLAKLLGADTLGYISLEDIMKLSPGGNIEFCIGCFSGKYPAEIPNSAAARSYERRLSDKDKQRE